MLTRKLLVVACLAGACRVSNVPGRDPDRRVNITLHGVVIGPVSAQGRAWDGPGLGAVDIELYTSAVDEQFPAGETPRFGEAVAGFGVRLTGSLFMDLDKPDPEGKIILGDDEDEPAIELEDRSNTFTPQWDVRMAQVLIEKTPIRLELDDDDVLRDDKIASFVIPRETLLRAEAGRRNPFAIDTSGLTHGTLLRVVMSIE
jgi:hypothetical protein